LRIWVENANESVLDLAFVDFFSHLRDAARADCFLFDLELENFASTGI